MTLAIKPGPERSRHYENHKSRMTLWEQEAPSSNLGIPTTFPNSPQTPYPPALALPAFQL